MSLQESLRFVKEFAVLKKYNSGFTLVELIVSLGLVAIALTGLTVVLNDLNTAQRNALTGHQMKLIGEAGRAYIRDNLGTIASTASATTPYLIPVSTLVSSSYALTGSSSTNAYGQSMCILVLQPTTGNYEAMLVSEGGTAVSDMDIGEIASVMNGEGGGIISTATSYFTGVGTGWKFSIGSFANVNNKGQNCSGSAGSPSLTSGHPVMALFFPGGDPSGGAVLRNLVPGQESLNAMSTPLIMNATETVGSACSFYGAIARDSTGNILSCVSGSWAQPSGDSYWKDPVSTFASLPTSSNKVGNVRLTTDTNRAFAWNGSSWVALAVDSEGNLNVPNVFTAGTVNANVITADGSIHSYGTLSADGNITTSSSLTASGSVSAGGSISGSYLMPTFVAVVGSACSYGNGAIAQDSSGHTLSCQSGYWRLGGQLSGTKSILIAHAGESLTCSLMGGYVKVTASIGSDGTPYITSSYYTTVVHQGSYLDLRDVTTTFDSGSANITATGFSVVDTYESSNCGASDECSETGDSCNLSWAL